MLRIKGIALIFTLVAISMVIAHNIVPHHHHEHCITDVHHQDHHSGGDHEGHDADDCSECGGLDPLDMGDNKDCRLDELPGLRKAFFSVDVPGRALVVLPVYDLSEPVPLSLSVAVSSPLIPGLGLRAPPAVKA